MIKRSIQQENITILNIFALNRGFPGGSGGKRVCLQCRRPRFDPWVRKIPGERNGYPLQYACVENSKDRGDWQATVHGVTKSQT